MSEEENLQLNKTQRSITGTIIYFILEVLFFIYFIFELFIHAPSRLREYTGFNIEQFIMWVAIFVIIFQVFIGTTKKDKKKKVEIKKAMVGVWVYVVSYIVLFIRIVDIIATRLNLFKTLPLAMSFNILIIIFSFYLVPALALRIIVEFKSIIKYAKRK